MCSNLLISKGVYNHRFCHSNEEQKPFKIEFSFEEIKPISPLIRNIQPRIRWPSANQSRIKLNNLNERGKLFQTETPKINDISRQNQSVDGLQFNANELRTSYSKQICSSLQKISKTVEMSKGLFTLKQILDDNQQTGVFTKKLSMISNPRKCSKRIRNYTPSIVINNQFFVNKYLIPRRLGEHN